MLGAEILQGATASAAPIRLDLPVACVLGRDCYIQHYLDRDAGLGDEDFACGPASYDGHDGTDFALPTRAAMRAGIEVRAAAAGKVRAVRDGEADGAFAAGAPVKGKECGNGVVIDHAENWQTQYCHLREGSITVHPGETVAAGAKLGLIGMSGLAEFPHLHLTLREGGAPVDPFHPGALAGCDPAPADTLWRDPPAYLGGGVLQIGLADTAPDYAGVKQGITAAPTLPATIPALILWAYGYDSAAGDRLSLSITGPDGFQFNRDEVLTKHQALFYRYAGKKAPAGGFTPGRYEARVTFTRGAQVLSDTVTALTLSP